ncbi:MAG: hypothetical protein B7C24_02935 [Bacteroidetes bacterium 4572_77]|nr:MAG: hypothetical protein B7C24_02935 [Bacteroidetes bacterium 4572_77]
MLVDSNKTKEQLLQEISNLKKKLAQYESQNQKDAMVDLHLEINEGEISSADQKQLSNAMDRIKLLSSVVEQSSEGMAIADTNNNIIYTNKRWAEMHGYNSYKELLGCSLQIFHSPEQIKYDVLPFIDTVLKQGFCRGEVGHITKDGKAFPTMMVTSLLKDKNGLTFAFVGTAIDISEQKKTQLALEKSEYDLRALFNAMTDIVFEMDHEGRYLNIAPTSANLMFKPSEDAIGKTLHEIFPKAEADLFLDYIRSCLAENKTKSIEYPLFIEGKTLWFEGKATPKTSNSVLYVARDISEQKNTELQLKDKEQSYKTLVNNLPGFAYQCKIQKDWMMTFISQGCEAITGYTSEEFTLNNKLSFNDIIAPEYQTLLWELWQKTIKNKGTFEYEYPIITKNGETKWLWERGNGIYDKNGDILYLEGFATDISQRKEAEKELKKINEKLLLSKDIIKESEEKYKSILNNMIDGYYRANKRGLIILTSPSTETMLGFSKQELIGKKVSSFYVNPSERDLFLKEVNKTGQVKNYPVAFRTKQKGNITLEVNTRILKDKHGDYDGVEGTFRDITERKITEERLLKLSTAIEQSPSIIVIIDTEKNVEYVNRAFTQISGYTTEEIIGKNLSFMKSGRDSINKYKNLWDIVIKEKSWKGELKNKKKNGEFFWASASVFPIFDENGIIKNYIKIAEDITEQKKITKSLQDSEEKYQDIIETASEGFWLLNAQGETIDMNESLCNILGYNRAEILGKKPYDFVNDENRKIFVDQLSKAKDIKHRTYDISLKTKKGNNIPTLFNATSIINIEGEHKGSFAFVTNISDRKRSEQIQKVIHNISNANLSSKSLADFVQIIKQELSTIIDTKNFYIAIYNEKNNTFSLPFYSDQKDQLTDFPAGKTLTAYVQKTKKPLLATTKTAQKLQAEGLVDVIGSDSKIWLGIPLINKGMATGVFAVQSYENKNAFDKSDMKMLEIISHQISLSLERKKAEEELKEALNKALESDRLKSAFLSNMSHEIRTPMNGIIGFVGMLNDPDIDEEEREQYMEVINRSSDRLLTTINDLIDISKIEAGQMPLSNKTISINKLLNELYDFFQMEAKAKELELFQKQSLPHSEDFILIDDDKLFSILSNLIKNALKYTKTGSINFGYTLRNDQLHFFVKDTGIGIPKERQEAIFNRFEQVDNMDARSYEGSGLGLSIASALAEILGGKIHLTSSPGIGSEFIFKIPYNKATP